MRRRVRCVLGVVVAAVAASSMSMSSQAASSSTVVTATVPSATNLTATLCAAGLAGRTELGVVQPGSSAVTTTDCAITFGSSNDDASLRMYQSDRAGTSMHRGSTGSVDTSWASSGYARRDHGGSEGAWSNAIVQSTGKVVVAGARNGDWFIARYNVDGTLDTSFNAPTGYRTLQLSAGANEWIGALVEQPDGMIVAAGATNDKVGIARFTADGLLDTVGFGAGAGFTVTNVAGSAQEEASRVELQSTGRIVVGGCAGSCDEFLLVGYTSAGIVDTTFSPGDGITRVAGLGVGGTVAMDVDSQDRIYTTDWGFCMCDVDVVRFTSLGALDVGWAGGGYATVDRNVMQPGTEGVQYANDLIVQSDGKIVLLGYLVDPGFGSERRLGLARINADGSTDTSFDGDGGIFLDTTHDSFNVFWPIEVRQLATGDYVVGGNNDDGIYNVLVAAKFSSTGVADTTFGTNGWVEIDPPGTLSPGTGLGGITELPDGALLLNAGSRGAANDDVELVRLGGTPVSDYVSLGGGGDTDWSSAGTTNMFGACLRDLSGGAVTGAGTWVADSASIGDEPALSADCGDGDSDPWNAIAQSTASPSAVLARVPPTVSTGAVAVRFGFRASTSQPPGRYVAPIVIDVVAPAV
jgi:uncharacterized delta-60 repeat protein